MKAEDLRTSVDPEKSSWQLTHSLERPDFCGSKAHFAASVKLTLGFRHSRLRTLNFAKIRSEIRPKSLLYLPPTAEITLIGWQEIRTAGLATGVLDSLLLLMKETWELKLDIDNRTRMSYVCK